MSAKQLIEPKPALDCRFRTATVAPYDRGERTNQGDAPHQRHHKVRLVKHQHQVRRGPCM